jgi:hypothetical protein
MMVSTAVTCDPNSAPALGLERLRFTVSSPSMKLSADTAIVKLLLVSPSEKFRVRFVGSKLSGSLGTE